MLCLGGDPSTPLIRLNKLPSRVEMISCPTSPSSQLCDLGPATVPLWAFLSFLGNGVSGPHPLLSPQGALGERLRPRLCGAWRKQAAGAQGSIIFGSHWAAAVKLQRRADLPRALETRPRNAVRRLCVSTSLGFQVTGQ